MSVNKLIIKIIPRYPGVPLVSPELSGPRNLDIPKSVNLKNPKLF